MGRSQRRPGRDAVRTVAWAYAHDKTIVKGTYRRDGCFCTRCGGRDVWVHTRSLDLHVCLDCGADFRFDDILDAEPSILRALRDGNLERTLIMAAEDVLYDESGPIPKPAIAPAKLKLAAADAK